MNDFVNPLCALSGFGRKDVVDFLLQNGANVHARDDGGLISLHNACSFGHAEVGYPPPKPPNNCEPRLQRKWIFPLNVKDLYSTVWCCFCAGGEFVASPRGRCKRQRQLELHSTS